jgi:alpha-beta hydrolase superfamily lysophospholipase
VIQSTTHSIEAPDGTRLLVREWEAASPWAAVLVVHGIGEHSGRYEQTGADLATAGLATISFDLRGHGSSGGHRVYTPNFDRLLDDLAAMLEETRRRGLPTVLLGHSLGGLIAFCYALSDRPRPDYLVLSAPALDSTVPAYRKFLGRILNRITPKLMMKNDFRGEQLSRDAAVGRAYFADPLVQTKTTVRLGIEAFRAMEYADQYGYRLEVPTLVIHGAADTLVPPTASAPLTRLALVERHLLPQFRHESFNEVGREQAISLVVDWIHARVEGGDHQAGAPEPAPAEDGEPAAS